MNIKTSKLSIASKLYATIVHHDSKMVVLLSGSSKYHIIINLCAKWNLESFYHFVFSSPYSDFLAFRFTLNFLRTYHHQKCKMSFTCIESFYCACFYYCNIWVGPFLIHEGLNCENMMLPFKKRNFCHKV